MFVSNEAESSGLFTIRRDGEDVKIDIASFEILEMDDMMGNRLDRAYEMHEAGDNDGAIAQLEPMIALGWFYPEAAVLLAGLYMSEQRPDGAIPLYEVLAEVTDNRPDIVFSLADALFQAGEREDALQALGRLADDEWPPDMAEAVAQLRLALG